MAGIALQLNTIINAESLDEAEMDKLALQLNTIISDESISMHVRIDAMHKQDELGAMRAVIICILQTMCKNTQIGFCQLKFDK